MSKRFDFHEAEAQGVFEALETYLLALARRLEGQEFVVANGSGSSVGRGFGGALGGSPGSGFSMADLALAAMLRPYQAVSSDGYEVEPLAAPSTHPLPKNEAFDPMASLIEQKWLLRGTAVSVVVSTVRGRAAPLVVPDPRWMALHKL